MLCMVILATLTYRDKKQQQSRVFFFRLNFNVYADVYNRERARSRDKKHEFSLETKT